jgi:hypothetical protein
MGMFSEIAAAYEAERLEKLLQTAKIEGGDVAWFAKLHIYPLYKDAVGETWGSMKMDSELVNFYEAL